ncbi:MAG TPA: M23 family metallopeptidase [Candidatus Acidoferrales bacterium]|nr:M23 family metallopeptidase [Candidatus Acidoferrales bacterium]
MKSAFLGAVLAFFLLQTSTKPETQHTAAAETPPVSSTKIELSSKLPSQGNLVRVTVKTAGPASEVEGEWGGHNVSFWQDERDKSVFHAYLGVDIDQKSGGQKFEVKVTPASSQPEVSEAMVTVRPGHYAIEKLTVAPKFVEPAPEDAERARKEGERLRAIYAERTGEKLWSGAFRFPLEGPRRGGNFGKRRVLNGEARAPHSGLDVPAATGTPVHAAAAGKIALADALYYSGNSIVIDHGLGLYTFYCHLSEIKVKEGDEVKEGDLIGLVGATGRVTGPHLHWGLIVNEAKVNPLQILPAERKPN